MGDNGNLQGFIFPAPGFSDEEALLPDVEGDGPNQLRARFQGRDIEVYIPYFELDGAAGQQLRIYLEWDGVRLKSYDLTFPLDPKDFPIRTILAATKTNDKGTYTLTYSVFTAGGTFKSDPLLVSVDNTAPNARNPGNKATLPEKVDSEGVTSEYMEEFGHVLITVSHDYGDASIGDVVSAYLAKSLAEWVHIGDFVRDDLNKLIEFKLTETMIGNMRGSAVIIYTLADRKGNRGPCSEPKKIEIKLP